MEWLELTIQTASGGIEMVAAALTLWGYDSFVLDDEAEFEDFLDHNRDYWDYVDEELASNMKGLSRIRLYLEDGPAAMEQVAQLRSQLASLREVWPDTDLGPLTVSLANLREEDWENNWKQYYQPIPIGERLLVVPEWLHPENPEGRIPVVLDPGMIFGTGNHASTRMCMQELERLVRGGERVLDLGSGSGILSITALLLGAATATGVDIDPKAEDAARENAGYNGFTAPEFTALTGDVTADPKLMAALRETENDLVLVNIVADVIIRLSALLPAFLRSGGELLCSGILDSRLEDVTAALENAGIQILETKAEAEWRSLRARLAASGTRSIGV